MYLAKFFHRPPGDDDRELLLIPGGHPMIIGIRMHGSVETQTEDFLREEFSDIGDAVATYRRHAAELVTAGYMETTHTRYTRRNLLSYPEAKREWQKGLDELMLAALCAPLENRRGASRPWKTPQRRASRSISGSRRTAASPPATTMNEPSGLPKRRATRWPHAGPARRRITHGRLQKATWKPGSSKF
jgi:hypothetical protein